jgi:hypothetical protein
MVTFTASGKTEAEFADMYGMDLKLVNRMLARVRSELAIKTEATTQKRPGKAFFTYQICL